MSELRVDCGPGYRVYFVQRSEVYVVLLAGGDKSTQHKALSPAGNPEFATILKVVAALGLQLHAAPASAKSAV